MAGRRLAISSLLCEDDPPPPQSSTSPAGPSYSPPPPLESGPAPFRNSYQPVYSDADPCRGPSPLPTGRDTLPPVSQLHDLSLRSTQPRPHQSLHTPHEYVNLRRDLQTSPFDGNDHINPTSVSSLTHTYSPLDYNRLRSHPSQPDPSQHQLPSFTPSESYTFHYHSPLIDSSPLLARPTSSRSHHSHSPSTSFSFPHLHHSQSPHHSHSPSHSPLLPHSTQSRRAPESPSLPVLRPSASPNNYYSTSYSPRHTQSPYTLHPVHNHSPNTQLHPSSTTFSEMSPHQHTPLLPLHSPSHVRPTLAALLTSSSPVSLSAASLPNLLNNVSPITRTPASAFRPLDALVQAASQERRRISGEAQKPPLLEDSPTQSAFQAEKTHEPLETRPYQPYSQQSSYDDPSQHVLTSPVSASRLLHDGRPLGNDYAPHIEEPPAKRRRSSIESLGPAGIAVTSQDVSKVSLRLPSPVVNTPTVPETTSAVLQESTPQEADTKPRLPPETLSEVRVETGGWSRPESHVPFAEGSGGAMSESGQRDENGRVDRKPAKTPGKQKGKEPSQIITAEPAKQRPHEHESQEQDPHEWLLEHYAASPTVAPAIPPPPDKATTVEAGRMTAQVDAKREKKNDAKAPSRGGKHKTKKPEMASHLKAPSPVPPNDIDLELELATASSHSHVPAKREDPAEMDVDDELLSLVDDKPQPSHASHHQPAPSHTSTHSHLENLKPNSANKLVASGHVITRSPSVTTTYTERGSMPPPSASTSIPPREDGKPSTKATDHPANVGASGSKKKDSVPKAAPKPKAAAKPKAKTAAKGKSKASKEPSAVPPANVVLSAAALALSSSGKGKKGSPFPGSGHPGTKRGTSVAVSAPSRSRSTSVMPPPSEPEKAGQDDGPDGKVEDTVDDKLYCVCKTGYDEDRVMIACDRCDEWYHTQCVNMPDLEVDLVDQFICPICVANNPNVSLKTTYKKRCLNGLKHPHPDSPQACHKPARGVFSKYCSDECGVLYMQARIKAWDGDKELLWESVKHAEKRESVVVRYLSNDSPTVKVNGENISGAPATSPAQEIVRPTKTKSQREVERLQALLDKVAGRREEIKKDMEVVLWREKLLELATARATAAEQCGWDQRLCFGDEDYAEFGPGVLESYEDEEETKAGDAMQVDAPEEQVWWCQGKKKCDRHSGWQKLRLAEVVFEKESIETLLSKLTAEERELRKRLEDVTDPHAQRSPVNPSFVPLQPLNGKVVPNGNLTIKMNGDAVVKKGKKRKQDAH